MGVAEVGKQAPLVKIMTNFDARHEILHNPKFQELTRGSKLFLEKLKFLEQTGAELFAYGRWNHDA